MKCDTKTMVRTGIGIGAVLVVAYFALPAFRAWIVASAPILLSLICPLSMLFMMKGMNACNKEPDVKAGKPEALPAAGNKLAE